MEENKNERLVKVVKILVVVCIVLVIAGVALVLTNVIMSNSGKTEDLLLENSSHESKGTYLEYNGESSVQSEVESSVVTESSAEISNTNSIEENSRVESVEQKSNFEDDSKETPNEEGLLSDMEILIETPQGDVWKTYGYSSEDEWNNADIYEKTMDKMWYNNYVCLTYGGQDKGKITGAVKVVLIALSMETSPYKDKISGATYIGGIYTNQYGIKYGMVQINFLDGDILYFLVGDSGLDTVMKDIDFGKEEEEFFKHFRLCHKFVNDDGKYAIDYV